MGYSDAGAYGSEIDTPNIDGLARSADSQKGRKPIIWHRAFPATPKGENPA